MKAYLGIQGKSSVTSEQQGYQRGRTAGFREGWIYGNRLGRVESFYAGYMQEESQLPKHELTVLYVASGIDVPYPAMDAAIIEELGLMVQKLIVAGPTDEVSKIAKEHRPDVVLALSGLVLPEEEVRTIREKGFRTAVWFTDDPYYTDWTTEIAPNYDYVFTLESSCVPFYKELGCPNVVHLPFGVNPRVFHPKIFEPSFRKEIAFVGSAFWNRVKAIDRIAPYLNNRNVMINGLWWDRLSKFKLLERHIRVGDWFSAEDTASAYNGAKIVINLHRLSDDADMNNNSKQIPAYSLNPRSFEIGACNTLQLVDYRSDLPLHYTPGKEVAVFHSVDELQERLEYYLQHEEERREIAFQGFLRTMKDHTYRKRLTQLLHAIVGG